MNRALCIGALAIALLSLPAAPARAWSCISSSCPKWCRTVPYAITITSPDLGEASSIMEVQRGMDEWQYPECSGLMTMYTGRSSAVAGRSGDGNSVVGWVESGWPHGGIAIGVTGPVWDFRNCILEADMELNGENYQWITGPGSGGRVNTFSIVMHEGGHYFGLGHSSDSSATMYGAYSGGIDMLIADDQTGICTLYPGDGTPPPDCTTSGCPAGQECVMGMCRPIMGDGSVCSPCRSNEECGGPADLCLRYPDGAGYCGASCSGAGDCGGDVCADLGGVRQCVRVVGGSPDCSGGPMGGCTTDSDCDATERCSGGRCEPRPTDLGDLGAACETGDQCNSGVCLASVCTQSCDWLDVASCPSGFYCDGRATGACGTGFCFAGTPGGTAMGESCRENTDCESLLCDSGLCATPCIPGGTIACPEGFLCQIGVGDCGSCKEVGRTGDACEMNEDCVTRLCAVAGDRTFCTALCTDASDCPSGYTCESAGGTNVCVPPVGGPPPGAVGSPCRMNDECDSMICAVSSGDSFCTEICADDTECPSGFTCEAAGGTTMVCAPMAGGGGDGCGCSVPGGEGRARWPLVFLLVIPAVVWLLRRRLFR